MSSSDWFPSKCVVSNYTQLLASFIYQFTQFFWPIDDIFSLLSIFSSNDLFDLGVLPRSFEVEFASAFKFLFGFDVRIEDPFSVLEWDVGAHSFDSLIENFNLFSCEFAVGNFKMLAI